MCDTTAKSSLLVASRAQHEAIADQRTPAAARPALPLLETQKRRATELSQDQQTDRRPFGASLRNSVPLLPSGRARRVARGGLRCQNNSSPHLTSRGGVAADKSFTWFCWCQNPIRTPYLHFAGNPLSQRAVNRSGRLLPDAHDGQADSVSVRCKMREPLCFHPARP